MELSDLGKRVEGYVNLLRTSVSKTRVDSLRKMKEPVGRDYSHSGNLHGEGGTMPVMIRRKRSRQGGLMSWLPSRSTTAATDFSKVSARRRAMAGVRSSSARNLGGRGGGGSIDWSWWFSRLAVAGFVCVVLGMFGVAGLFAWYSRDLPDPTKVVRRAGFATKILDREGQSLYDVYADEKRVPVTFDQLPETLKWATIATEDKTFYEHSGFDILGLVRGLSRGLTRGRAQGGSTLTQQLVKNVLLTSERSLTRKIKEFVLAVQIERKFSKDEILLMYLNEAPYGGTAWGVGAGAEQYFNKEVNELNLIESAILAGLPQSPTRYSPYGSDPEAFKTRTQAVLRRMWEDGYITDLERESALSDLDFVEFSGTGGDFKAPHFVMYVRELLEERYGSEVLEGGGLRVTTTLDLELQEAAQEIVAEEIADVADLGISNGAGMVMDVNTGEILAMIGSRGYADEDIDGKVNVLLTDQQPGSTIKPLTYVAGFREGYTPATVLMDVQTKFPGGAGQDDYEPVNYDGKYRGPVMVREALGSSLNIPAVKMLALVGVRDVMKLGYEMGLSTFEPTQENMSRVGLSLTLGGGDVKPLELVSAYSAFANGGHLVEPTAILKVEDNNGKVLEEYVPSKGRAVLSEEEAWLMSDMLADNNARLLTFGQNSALNVGKHVAVKTGTTNDKRDNWTIGWSPEVIVGVWVGNNDNTPMREVASGVSGASPIWRRIILKALDGRSSEPWERPEGIIEMEVDEVSGYAAHDEYPVKVEYFISGTEPTGEDPIHTRLKVCKSDNSKLANEIVVSRGQYDEKEFYVFKEEDPFENGSDWGNEWQKGILNWIFANHKDNPLYNPPTEYCQSEGDIVVYMIEPKNETELDSNSVKIKVDPVSVHGVSKVEFYVDGSLVSALEGRPWEDEISIDDGAHTIKVVARDNQGNQADTEVKIGVNVPWDYKDEPTPTPTKKASPTPSPTPEP